ncbi:MAG: ATPase, T2SS/T4P/T4SS family [Candidatus Diapherotrites archaeon]|nr:ATPase, T2SS/T4P/T4SS family [Candidatus Diapherotrites archaeon]
MVVFPEKKDGASSQLDELKKLAAGRKVPSDLKPISAASEGGDAAGAGKKGVKEESALEKLKELATPKEKPKLSESEPNFVEGKKFDDYKISTQTDSFLGMDGRKGLITQPPADFEWLKQKNLEERSQSSNLSETNPDWFETEQIEAPLATDFEGWEAQTEGGNSSAGEQKGTNATGTAGAEKEIPKQEATTPVQRGEQTEENAELLLGEESLGSAKEISEKIEKITTPIDTMFELLSVYKEVDAGKLVDYIGISLEKIEEIARLFENDGIIEIEYPPGIQKKPRIKLKKEITSRLKELPKGKMVESYDLVVDFIPAKISIIAETGEVRPTYCLEVPAVGKYTKQFLEYIKGEVAESTPIELEDILDQSKARKLKKKYFEQVSLHMLKYFPNTPEELLRPLGGIVLHEMYGLGDLDILMGDPMLEEIAINSSKTPVTIYHIIHGWLKTNIIIKSEEEVINYSAQIGRKIGREISVLNPILDAHLTSGDRVNATLFPISAEGNTLTIRRFARRPWTIIDFIGRSHSMNSEMAALLWLAIQYEMNILVAGGTASGKTSTLNGLLALTPSYHRLISIEDVRELILPSYLKWNWVPLVTRPRNPEGLGEVEMLELMVTSLRMRPDRIIVGEIRRHEEAEVLMEAVETGHSIYSTMHANSAYQVLRRLSEPPISIPSVQIELIDLILVQYRDRKTNKRRTYELAEIEPAATGQGLQVNTIYKWVPREDSWERLNRPVKLLTLLNLHTGMTEEEIYGELEDRKTILDWMRNSKIDNMESVGKIMKLFYSDPEKIKELAKKNAPVEEAYKVA